MRVLQLIGISISSRPTRTSRCIGCGELPQPVTYKPVLFAGLLNHWGQKGPAEIPAKRRWTYRWCTWWAKELGIPFRFPAAAPVQSAAPPAPRASVRQPARGGQTHFRIDLDERRECERSRRASPRFAASSASPEAQLAAGEGRSCSKEHRGSRARGVFGVPSFVVDGEVFWGADAIDFLKAFLRDRTRAAQRRNAPARRPAGRRRANKPRREIHENRNKRSSPYTAPPSESSRSALSRLASHDAAGRRLGHARHHRRAPCLRAPGPMVVGEMPLLLHDHYRRQLAFPERGDRPHSPRRESHDGFDGRAVDNTLQQDFVALRSLRTP